MWSLQSTYRDLKNQLSKAQNSIDSADLAHVALVDSKGQLIHIEGSHPLHFFGFSQTIPAVQKYFKLAPGEIILTNDPAFGSPRLCDLNFISPIYKGKEIKAFGIVQVTITGLLNTEKILSAAKLEDEGFKIPPTPLDNGGAMEAALLNYLHPSGVSNQKLEAVFRSARKALGALEKSYEFFESKWGKNEISTQIKKLQDYTENLMRTALHRFPDGDFTTQMPLARLCELESGILQTQIRVHGSSFIVNFLGTSKASPYSLNMSHHVTLSACLWFFMSLLGEDIPINSGILSALSVEAPQGTLVNAPPSNATLGGYYQTSQIILASLKALLSKALPREAEDCLISPSLTLAIKTKGKIYIENFGSGTSARTQKHGYSCIKSDVNNVPVLPVEKIESEYPLTVESQSLRILKEKSEVQMGGRGLSLMISAQDTGQICVLSGHYRDQQEVVVEREGKRFPLKTMQPQMLHSGDKVSITTFNGYNSETAE